MPMIEPGDKVVNTRTGTLWEIIECETQTFRIRFSTPAGVNQVEIAEHYHIGWHEEFQIIEGEAAYVLDGQDARAKAGERVVFPERVRHIHPYNAGPGSLVFEQFGTVKGCPSDAVQKTFAFFFTMLEWEASGKIKLDKIGLPAHPMRFALAGRILGNAGGYDARLPKVLADFGSATFGRLAEALGYEVIDRKYL